MPKSPIGWAILVFLALIFCSFAYASCELSDECKSKGGVYVCPHGSSCICLKSDLVIPL